jgi:uncharacterized phage-associated protein
MAAHSSMAIANEFLKLQGGEVGLTQMQLQKLAYIAHGWNLAINGEPLIAEDVQAWDNGPVFRELWDHLTRYGSAFVTKLISPANKPNFFGRDLSKEPYKAKLSKEERAVIEHCWKRYGRYGAFRLSGLTHQEGTPWYKTYFVKGKNAVIDPDEIRQHYVKLARAARAG